MKFTSLVALFSSASVVSSTFVLLPLYIYPGTNGANWAQAFSAISSHPSVDFQVVVNPDSGPGGANLPDSNYIYSLNKLNSYNNVQTIGYVHTSYTNVNAPYSSYSLLISNITKYANWANYAAADIHVEGIFFDEVLATPYTAPYTYYKNASTYAYNTVPSDVTPVIFNPGTLASNSSSFNYFHLCDTIIEYEDTYANYNPNTAIPSVGSYKAQSAFVINTTPKTVNLTTITHPLVSKGFAGLYVASDLYYQDLSLLNSLATSVAAG